MAADAADEVLARGSIPQAQDPILADGSSPENCAMLLTLRKNVKNRDRRSGGQLDCAFTLLPVRIDFLSLEVHEHGS